jgi:hypothetical protein
VTVRYVLTHAEISGLALISVVLSISIVFSTVRRKESYFKKKNCEDLKTLVGFEVMMLCEVPLRMQGRHASPVLLQDFRF